MGAVLGVVRGWRDGGWVACHYGQGDYGGVESFMVSKKKFVRDIMRMQDERRFAEKEAEALAIVENENVYEGYMHNKRYGKGKKCTKFQYQC